MDWKLFALVFGSVFLAELGDKMQIATMLFSADREVNKWVVFGAASLALIATSAIGVVAGSVASQYVSQRVLHMVAGTAFVLIGLWMLLR